MVTRTMSHAIAFVDGTLPDLARILADRDPAMEIVILSGTVDGVVQMANHLAGRSGIDAIHIYSHGAPGKLFLGNTVLDAASMQGGHAGALALIGAALSENGDILVYGCEFAAGEAGAQAVGLLAEVTGADIAASGTLTGHADLGGDWELDVKLGAITSAAIAVPDYAGTLPAPTIDLDTTDNTAAITVATDNFESGTYTGGTGWTGGWTEVGETTSATAGDIQIVADGGDRSLRIGDGTDNAVDTIQRTVNLSGLDSAALAFDFRRAGMTAADETVTVQISTNGINFTTIATFGNTSPTTYAAQGPIDISAWISANTTIRINASTTLDNGSDFGYFDNIAITGVPSAAPTGFETVALTGAAPVAIASSNVEITDSDDALMQSATITLTNAQTGDALSVIGTLPGAITASAYNPATGVLTLTGSASLADYQAAIEQIGFSATDGVGTDRTITVTVNDGTANSAPVTSTIVVDIDTDGDGIGNATDIDDDNDGLLDADEVGSYGS